MFCQEFWEMVILAKVKYLILCDCGLTTKDIKQFKELLSMENVINRYT